MDLGKVYSPLLGGNMSLGWILAGFCIFVTLLFLVLAFFLPEWVGITGERAKEIMKEQQGEPQEPQSRAPRHNQA